MTAPGAATMGSAGSQRPEAQLHPEQSQEENQRSQISGLKQNILSGLFTSLFPDLLLVHYFRQIFGAVENKTEQNKTLLLPLCTGLG